LVPSLKVCRPLMMEVPEAVPEKVRVVAVPATAK
jgi:hypothetical protein